MIPRSETIADRLNYLLPGVVSSGKIPRWPPDVFCLCASLLQSSGGYLTVVEDKPPHLRGKTSDQRWREIESLGKKWRGVTSNTSTIPPQLQRLWKTILSSSHRPIDAILRLRPCCAALVDLLAAADEASVGVGIGISGPFMRSSWRHLAPDTFLEDAEECLLPQELGSTLCLNIDPSRGRVLPKMHTPQNGLTIRSLSHNLAFCPSSDITPLWFSVGSDTRHHALNLLVVPWPELIEPSQFRESRQVQLTDEVKRGGYGLFTYDAGRGPTSHFVTRLIKEATRKVGQIDGLILPELAMSRSDYTRLARAVVTPRRFMISGVGEKARNALSCGTNEVMMDVRNPESPLQFRLTQKKHHRWKLNKSQIIQYGIGSNLHPEASWWEHISLKDRTLAFVTIRPWLTFAVLVCEDLARPDPVGDLLRAVGPNFVVALLMDGPQLTSRWPGRYAGALADDPGCSVLTLTSAGMSGLSQPVSGGPNRSRVIALWRDPQTGVRELELPAKASALVLNVTVEYGEEWTADGRGDGRVSGYPILAGYHPISIDKRDGGS